MSDSPPEASRFLPRGPDATNRIIRVVSGLMLFGLAIALMVRGELGLPPWDVFHQGVAELFDLGMGVVVIAVGAAVMLLWIPLRERPGFGTIANIVIIGSAVELFLWLIPVSTDPWIRWPEMVGGALLFGPGSGLYIGAGLGPGPRDGLMTGIARRGVPVAAARTFVELVVLGLGWLLGGTVGVGTIVFAATVGPNVAYFIERWSLPPVDGSLEDNCGETALPTVG